MKVCGVRCLVGHGQVMGMVCNVTVMCVCVRECYFCTCIRIQSLQSYISQYR